jgi:hypothetical protein
VFDRAVDVALFDGTQVVVDDQPTANLFKGLGGAILAGPATVEVGLVVEDTTSGTEVLLDATALTGIVAVDDGGTWAGVSGLVLPFP